MLGSMSLPAITLGGNQTQELIAPVIDSLVADRSWSVCEQFIYAGTLYKVTTAIAVGDQIILGSGGNADTAISITEQMYSINDIQRLTLTDDDAFPYYAHDNLKRKTPWSNIKEKLKTYFNSLYQSVLTEGAVTITNTSVVTATDTYNRCYRWGNVVVLNISANFTTPSTAWTKVFTLDSSVSPGRDVYFLLIDVNRTVVGYAYVGVGGVWVQMPSSVTNKIRSSVAWIIGM